MTANILPIVSSYRATICGGIILHRFQVVAKSDKGAFPYFIDFHQNKNMVFVPRICPCDSAYEELCYKTPVSSRGIHVQLMSLLATVMDLYESMTSHSHEDPAIIISGNYNLGESEDRPSRKATLYMKSFKHSKYSKIYTCIKLDKNTFLLQRLGSTLQWPTICETYRQYCEQIEEINIAIRAICFPSIE